MSIVLDESKISIIFQKLKDCSSEVVVFDNSFTLGEPVIDTRSFEFDEDYISSLNSRSSEIEFRRPRYDGLFYTAS